MRTRLALAATLTLATISLGTPTAEAAPPPKLDVCHVGDGGTARLVSIPERAARAHLAHGDAVPGDPVPGMSGYQFDGSCAPVLVETIFAVAYTDVVDDGAGYDPDVDVLISKLVDANGSGVPDAGDQVVTDRYPLDIDATRFGSFGVTEHDVTGVTATADGCLVENSSGGVFRWLLDSTSEFYGEGDANITPAFPVFGLNISDIIGEEGSTDTMSISRPEWSASEPEGVVANAGFSSTDDTFIDVEIDCGD